MKWPSQTHIFGIGMITHIVLCFSLDGLRSEHSLVQKFEGFFLQDDFIKHKLLISEKCRTVSKMHAFFLQKNMSNQIKLCRHNFQENLKYLELFFHFLPVTCIKNCHFINRVPWNLIFPTYIGNTLVIGTHECLQFSTT